MINNCYLPNILHRVFNAIAAIAICVFVAIVGMNYFYEIPWILKAAKWLLYLSPLIGILCAVLNPLKFSIVEGLAGDAGYDELDVENEDQNKL